MTTAVPDPNDPSQTTQAVTTTAGGAGTAVGPASVPGANLSLVKPSLPRFEGAPVDGIRFKINGNGVVDDSEDLVVSMDDVVRIIAEYRVVGVTFKLDTKTGDIVREHILKPSKMAVCPWDPNDPTDDGVVRARPGYQHP